MTVPFGNRFYCVESFLSILKEKEMAHLYGKMEGNRGIQTGSLVENWQNYSGC